MLSLFKSPVPLLPRLTLTIRIIAQFGDCILYCIHAVIWDEGTVSIYEFEFTVEPLLLN